MPTLFEGFTTSENAAWGISPSIWRAQLFVPSRAHRVTEVRIALYRTGTPVGDIVASIRAVSGAGDERVPTGADLASGTYDGDSLPLGVPLQTITFNLDSPLALQAAVSYAIVLRHTLDVSHIGLGGNTAPPNPYPKGHLAYSSDSGVTWPVVDLDLSSALSFQELGLADTLLHVPIGGKVAAGVVAARNS